MGELISKCKLSTFLMFFTAIALFPRKSLAIDSIKAGESINGSTQILVSSQQNFVLGIFTPQGSKFKYLGIWYKNITQTIVWVANRDNPLVNSSAKLTVNKEGNILLLNETDGVLWSSPSPGSMKHPIAQLLNTGNLVLRESGSENYVWQSFDYPSDTLLSGMKLGWDSKSGLNRKLTSWNSSNDPSYGDFTYSVHLGGLPQFIVQKGDITTYRGGPWNGDRFSGSGPLRDTPIYSSKFQYGDDEMTYSYNATKNSTVKFVLNSGGILEILYWDDDKKYWHSVYELPGDRCDEYGLCGNFGVCTLNLTAQCDCMNGFITKLPQDDVNFKWSDGCVRRDDNQICGSGDRFNTISSVKLPDSSEYLVNVSMTIHDCNVACRKNCSCLGYAVMVLSTGATGCITWYQKLMDVRIVPENGQNLYVRVGAFDLDSGDTGRRKLIVGLSVSMASLICCLILVVWFILWRRRKVEGEIQAPEKEVAEMPLYDFLEIEAATNNFSPSNKIGEGGFGPVFKGNLPSGQEIAVKRLAEGSGQGQTEFKNEILLISKLQHRNLVKLLGFSTHQEETLLIYEYMPNKSLNYFLFDDTKRSSLNWKKRLDIVIGIARGLLYLHRDSRLIIIHRDLKVSNILLDNEMNPKISDFGIARMSSEDQTMTRTNRVVGTYGYMSPEYVIDGYFSLKSDIFSFGVILLEIVSGKKNRGYYHTDHNLNLLGHAWKLWEEGNALEIMDETLKEQFQDIEALRCIQVGLLCVQENPDERPTMGSVLSMLESESMVLSHPKRPGFYTERLVAQAQNLPIESPASNKVTITELEGR